MQIEDKYIKLFGKCVYNKRLEKYGRISSFEVMSSIGMYSCFRVYYDKFDDNSILTFDDVEKGEVSFVVITGNWSKDYNLKEIEDIKFALGDKFTEHMIIHITDDEWKEWIRNNDKRNIQKLHTDLISLTEISAEVMADDYYSRELYLKYKKGELTEKELQYALVNHLCQEYKRVWDQNGRYFFKYEFLKEIEKMGSETET